MNGEETLRFFPPVLFQEETQEMDLYHIRLLVIYLRTCCINDKFHRTLAEVPGYEKNKLFA